MIGSCRQGSQPEGRRNSYILPTERRSPQEIAFGKEVGRRGYHENKVRSRKVGKDSELPCGGGGAGKERWKESCERMVSEENGG